MAVDLSDFVDVLRREINPPGSALFDEVLDEELTGHLADAFWEARLDGLVKAWTADEDGIVEPLKVGGSELGREWVALLVLYAGIRMLRNHLMNQQTTFRAEAGPVSFETQSSATVLAELLKQLQATKLRLLEMGQDASLDAIVDGYTVRMLCPGSYGGFLAGLFHELRPVAF